MALGLACRKAALLARFPPGAVMHGRDTESQKVSELLQRAQQGLGGVLLIDGEWGIGKSLFLREASDEAAARGFSLAAGSADPLRQIVPFAALLGALGEHLGVPTDEEQSADVTQGMREIRACLEQRAAATPVLVTLDDLQWASPATLLALRVLPGELARCKLAWILARSVLEAHPHTQTLFTILEREGASRITLSPLSEDAVQAVLTDAFGAPPDRELMGMASGTAGLPLLLTELINGLREEDAVEIADGHACLLVTQPPQSVPRAIRQRFDGLSARARQLLKTAAVLGQSFMLEDVAGVLGETAAALLSAVEEVAAAGIVVAADDAFSFRGDFIWHAAENMTPPPGRKAVHRQFGEILLNRDEPAAAARHLLEAVHANDPASLTDLDQLAAQTLNSYPQVAAQVALRALRLTPQSAPDRVARSVAAAEAATAGGRLEMAEQIVHEAMAQPAPSDLEVRLRCALSHVRCMNGQTDHASSEAEAVLAEPLLTPELREQAMSAQLNAVAGPAGNRSAGRVASAILSAAHEHTDRLVAGALVAQAMTRWGEGQISSGLELLRDAVRQCSGVSPDARDLQPLLTLAACLVDLRRFDEAETVLQSADTETLKGIPAEVVPRILRARMHLARGRLVEAASAGESALAIASAMAAPAYASVARSVLGAIALRRGDLETASAYLAERSACAAHFAASYAQSETAVTGARIVGTRDGAVAAIGEIRDVCIDLPRHTGILFGEPSTSAWLVRAAVAADHGALAAKVARVTDTLAVANPDFPVIAAAAAHSQGLLSQDPARLSQAIADHQDPWSRASASEDLGVLYVTQDKEERAISHLGEALDGYRQVGAAMDQARVRRRLRELGVRRRHWTQAAQRPVAGWASLTEKEIAISELVAQGLNNRQIAGRLFVSVHTVAFHLRSVFRKLNIGSRVELARITLENTDRCAGLPWRFKYGFGASCACDSHG